MIPDCSFTFNAPMWLYQGPGAWHFITVPVEITNQIKSIITGPRRGWGSVRVKATIGSTVWATSIFPYKEVSSFILPIKAQVRKAENLSLGDTVFIRITLVEN